MKKIKFCPRPFKKKKEEINKAEFSILLNNYTYPSSARCSSCGKLSNNIIYTLDLKTVERIYCPYCGEIMGD